jgi:hypothetical protein
LSDGFVFTSNIEVDDYFRSFYGLDRQHPASEGEAQRRSTSTTSSPTLGAGDRGAASPLPVSIEVRRAFNSYSVAKSMAGDEQN